MLNKVFIFVDEVQKCPEIFDAIKYAFDKNQVSFIVSGSNPAFLSTSAKNLLQRRAEVFTLFPFSIKEILQHNKFIPNQIDSILNSLFFKFNKNEFFKLNPVKLSPNIKKVVEEYLVFGGLPRVYLTKDIRNKMQEIKLIAERGITETYNATVAVDDEIRTYLAQNHCKEFAYKGAQQSIRNNKRQVVDKVVDHLMNHGYIFKKTPYLFEYQNIKSSYHSIYSWVDPGLVTYFTGKIEYLEVDAGFRIEAYVHIQLYKLLERIPLRSLIYYYKPFSYKEANDSLSFKEGEIDFIISVGDQVIPAEVKKTHDLNNIDSAQIENVIEKYNLNYGIIFYGGSLFYDKEKKILFYPFWYL